MIGRTYDDKLGAAEKLYGKQEVGLCTETKKQSNITEEVMRLRETASNLHEIVTMLEQKTVSFMKPVPVNPESESDRPEGSELQRALYDINTSLSCLKSRLIFMYDSVDV